MTISTLSLTDNKPAVAVSPSRATSENASTGSDSFKVSFGLIIMLVISAAYLGLMLFLDTSSPFLIVKGTSMEPTFSEGDVLVSRGIDYGSIEVGDVIAFKVPIASIGPQNLPPMAVHRVTGVNARGGLYMYLTKGDNANEDPFTVPASDVKGKVIGNLGPIGVPFLTVLRFMLITYIGLPILAFAVVTVVFLLLVKGNAPKVADEKTGDAMLTDIDNSLNKIRNQLKHLHDGR